MENNKLSSIRNQRGLKQGALARMTGTTQSQISRFENGTIPPPDIQEKIAEVLDCSIEELAFPVKEERLLNHRVHQEEEEAAPAGKDPSTLHQGGVERVLPVASSKALFKPNPRVITLTTILTISLIATLLLALVLVFYPPKGKTNSPSASPTPVQRTEHPSSVTQPSPIEPEAVIIQTKDQKYSFPWIGTMEVSLNNVVSIETGKKIGSWRYIQNGKQQREPDNFDMHLHVCAGQTIKYDPPIRLIRLYIVAASPMVNCVPRSSV